jgi:hypothetical protein
MPDTLQSLNRPSTLRLELDLPDIEPVAALFATWGFRTLFDVDEPERCLALTDGFFTWLLAQRPAPAQLCLHYLTPDWTAWLATSSPQVQQHARDGADPVWGISFEASERVHVQVQQASEELELPPVGVSLLPDGRFAEVGIGTRDLPADEVRWGQLGFTKLHGSAPDEPPHVLLFDGTLLVGLYAEASWDGPALAFYASNPAAKAEEATRWGLAVDDLDGGAWRVWLPGELPVLWLPEFREAEEPDVLA